MRGPDEASTRKAPLSGETPVVVVGLMGAGKSTLARALADRLRRPLRDSDRDIQAGTGRRAVDLAAELGRAALHDIEARHLVEAVAGEPAVVATAASTIEHPQAQGALAAAVVVWLDGPPELLAARFASGPHRPDYGLPLDVLREQDARRRPLFAAAADIVVDAGASPTRQVEGAMAELAGRGIGCSSPPTAGDLPGAGAEPGAGTEPRAGTEQGEPGPSREPGR